VTGTGALMLLAAGLYVLLRVGGGVAAARLFRG
jgi:hypothetical protein